MWCFFCRALSMPEKFWLVKISSDTVVVVFPQSSVNHQIHFKCFRAEHWVVLPVSCSCNLVYCNKRLHCHRVEAFFWKLALYTRCMFHRRQCRPQEIYSLRRGASKHYVNLERILRNILYYPYWKTVLYFPCVYVLDSLLLPVTYSQL